MQSVKNLPLMLHEDGSLVSRKARCPLRRLYDVQSSEEVPLRFAGTRERPNPPFSSLSCLVVADSAPLATAFSPSLALSVAPPLRKRSRQAHLLGCKRPRDGEPSLPTFCGVYRKRGFGCPQKKKPLHTSVHSSVSGVRDLNGSAPSAAAADASFHLPQSNLPVACLAARRGAAFAAR